MTKVLGIEVALRDEYERLARHAEAMSMDPASVAKDRTAAIEAAKGYWQLSRFHADAVLRLERLGAEENLTAEQQKTQAFRASNVGTQRLTQRRLDFLAEFREAVGKGTRKEVIRIAAGDRRFSEYFSAYEVALAFANRHKI